jgi:hypothetical protein
MAYRTTTSYGSWCNNVNEYSTSLESDVSDFISGGDNDWQRLLVESGAFQEICDTYRQKINEALPASVTLAGDEFVGPHEPEDGEWDGCPVDEYGGLDIKAIVDSIDLSAIVEAHEPLTLEDIGRDLLNSKAKNPAKVASAAMSRVGLKPFTYLPHPESGRPQAIYLQGAVKEALAKRPGRGKRTDLKDAE